ncbi:PBECR2 nuclease fold domain-containing protein [Paraburkholderia sp.]|uniref:PBECR2 nuclease fold domain-containing protein n=1 Tax=Paraburkholderia sp. TaxID=1926495 RepID=UPI002D3A21C6|nr:PBECR2 nuclease fold domain-containing protein [Paraburkholderia sp.]HZZ04631.1 PBECR2 nuclease fold domain-containing protein [Paraburkholderia sp.]
MPADLGYAIGLQPDKAIEYFESKGYKIGFRWQDVAAEAHAKAFTVAGVMKVDVLQDVRQALSDALEKGTTFEDFKKQLSPVLERKGWLGKGMIVDDETGEIEGKRLTPRRLDTIFRTNMQSAYMAGRYATQLEQVDTHPYWEYVAVLDSRTRPAHRALSGAVYRYDDPFWQTFYPPNGYRCRCRVRTRTSGYIQKNDIAVRSGRENLEEVEQVINRDGQTQPAIAYKDPATGKKVLPDPGFGSNPGAQWMKPFTPPPLDTLPQTFPHGAELPPLPAATTIRPNAILPTGQAPEQYAQAFMQKFGAAVGKPATFADVTGERLQINEWLFKDGAGHWKADKFSRGPYMELLADAVKDPDEIWLAWSQAAGDWTLRRRYIRALETEAGDWGLAIFEQGQDGWTGVTTFPAKVGKSDEARRDYIDRQRGTFLRYRRPQK